MRGSLMLMHVEDATLESASCSRPASMQPRSTEAIWRLRNLFLTSSCSKNAGDDVELLHESRLKNVRILRLKWV
jgi:hypothetical protein